jgi:hypothetical protein
VTFDITVNTYVRMCENIIPGHTCDEYSILISKPGMTMNKLAHKNNFASENFLCVADTFG